MPTKERFSELCLKYGVSSDQTELFYVEFKSLIEPPKETNQLIQAYCDAFKIRWGTYPAINGKATGIAKRLVKDLGLERAISLIETYLKMDDYTFQMRRHDLATFEMNLNAVLVKQQTGRGVTSLQARSSEQADGNLAVMKSYLEKKRER